jgi:hypothetical protein
MRSVRPFVLAFSLLSLPAASAWADEPSPPKTTANRPAAHPQETSLPHDQAPPANGSQVTGSTNQNPTVKEMNAEEKKKLDVEGK